MELFKSTEGFAPELLKLPLQRISFNEDDNDFVTDDSYRLDMEEKLATVKLAVEEFKTNKKISDNLAAKLKKDAEEKVVAQDKVMQEEESRLRALLEKEKQEILALKMAEEEEKRAERDSIKTERNKQKLLALEKLKKEEEQFKLEEEEFAREEKERKCQALLPSTNKFI